MGKVSSRSQSRAKGLTFVSQKLRTVSRSMTWDSLSWKSMVDTSWGPTDQTG